MRVARAGPAATSQNLPCIFGVAPCFSAGFSFGSFDNTFDVQRAEHDGEYVTAVELGSILGMEKYGLQGEDRFFYRSSLDLEAITGVEGLSKNILPIGAL